MEYLRSADAPHISRQKQLPWSLRENSKLGAGSSISTEHPYYIIRLGSGSCSDVQTDRENIFVITYPIKQLRV